MILAFGLAGVCLVLAAAWGILLLAQRAHARARQWRMGLQELEGFLVHPGLFYHPGHTWVLPEGNGTVRVGLDDFGRRLVDGIHRVGLPAKGTEVHRGSAVVELDCGRNGAKLLSPVDGVITAVNGSVAEDGSILERDPYGKGWLFQVEASERSFRRLPTERAALEWMRREAGRLAAFVHDELGVATADGGELVAKPPRMLNAEQWESLATAFFRVAPRGAEERGRSSAGKE